MIEFKVWDQARDGATMGIRVANVQQLRALSAICNGRSRNGSWSNLQSYLVAAARAASPRDPYDRTVDVLWLRSGLGVPKGTLMQNRVLNVTYTGRVRASGGFASQAYVIVDPSWAATLAPHDKTPLDVDYYAGGRRDLVIVR